MYFYFILVLFILDFLDLFLILIYFGILRLRFEEIGILDAIMLVIIIY